MRADCPSKTERNGSPTNAPTTNVSGLLDLDLSRAACAAVARGQEREKLSVTRVRSSEPRGLSASGVTRDSRGAWAIQIASALLVVFRSGKSLLSKIQKEKYGSRLRAGGSPKSWNRVETAGQRLLSCIMQYLEMCAGRLTAIFATASPCVEAAIHDGTPGTLFDGKCLLRRNGNA